MDAGPLPLKPAAKRVVKNVGTAAQQIARGDFKSKFLRLFRGEQRQNLALLEFYDIHTIDQIVERLVASDGKPSELLLGIIESAPFQKRRTLSRYLPFHSAQPTGKLPTW